MVKTVLLPLLAGCGAGILSAWGVGGGTLLLLVMTLWLGVEQPVAKGINLLYFLPTAAAGLICHGKHGLLDREVIRCAVPWGLLAAAAGAWLSTAVDPALLRRPFGVFLLLAGAATLLQKDEK
ncbi:MAG: TSUP family transporter [Oscillospiraceae bacterium]|nr:TSUP family transporter [Oscillospiraceae bacterium]